MQVHTIDIRCRTSVNIKHRLNVKKKMWRIVLQIETSLWNCFCIRNETQHIVLIWCVRLISKALNFMHKNHRKTVAKEMISGAQSDLSFKKWLISGEETLFYKFENNLLKGASNTSRNQKKFKDSQQITLSCFMF